MLFAFLLVLSLGNRALAVGTPLTEYEVKAAFLYNFAQFAEWPPKTFAAAKAPLTIGILGEDPFGNALDVLVKDEVVAGHPLVVKRFAPDAEISNCQVLFISRSEKDRIPALLEKLRLKPVLTVSEAEKFAEHGGIIHFFMENGKVRFEINPEAAERTGLKINSNLLRVARIVKDNGS